TLWTKIPGFSAYELSKDGRVRRAINSDLYGPGHRKKPGEILKPSGKYGCYALVNDEGKIIRGIRTNRLMLSTFVKPPPSPKHQALHGNDNQADNSLGNLRWGLPKDNGADAVKNGKTAKGVRNGSAVVTDDIVLRM